MDRCGIDTVEVARVERLLAERDADGLAQIFAPEELRDAGDGPGRAASLAARLAAKEACLKLFPRETALSQIEVHDFIVSQSGYGGPQIACTPRARGVLDRHRIERIAVSLTHSGPSASAVTVAEPATIDVPLSGRLIYHLLPIRRRVIMENLHRAYGGLIDEREIVRIAQAHYGHCVRLVFEFLRLPFVSEEDRKALVRVENIDAMFKAATGGRGVLVLTGHFGIWEVSTVIAISTLPQLHGRFHFMRRRLWPRWFNRWVYARFERAGFGLIPKQGAVQLILDRLDAGEFIVFIYDQHAGGRSGVGGTIFGYPVSTFRTLALASMATGASVVPAASWREPDGTSVIRFEEPIACVEHDDVDEAVRVNTQRYNDAFERLVLRHPEQWGMWMHRMWKGPEASGEKPFIRVAAQRVAERFGWTEE